MRWNKELNNKRAKVLLRDYVVYEIVCLVFGELHYLTIDIIMSMDLFRAHDLAILFKYCSFL